MRNACEIITISVLAYTKVVFILTGLVCCSQRMVWLVKRGAKGFSGIRLWLTNLQMRQMHALKRQEKNGLNRAWQPLVYALATDSNMRFEV